MASKIQQLLMSKTLWLVLILLVTMLVYRDDLLKLFHVPTMLNVYDDDINDGAQKIRQNAQVLGDWEVMPRGLGLSRGHSGEIVYKITKEANEDVILVLWFYWNQLRQNRVLISTDGVHYQTVVENTHMIGRSLRLTPYVLGHSEVWIRLTSQFTEAAPPETWIVLDKIQIVKVKNPIDLPYLPGIFLFIVIPLTIFLWSRALIPKAAVGLLAAVLGLEVLASSLWPSWVSARFPSEGLTHFIKSNEPIGAYQLENVIVSLPWSLIVYAAGIAIVILYTTITNRFEQVRGPATASLLIAIIALGFALRWEALIEFQYRPLDPDATAYRVIADRMKHIYDTDHREPMWIWTIKLWFLLLGPSDLSLRLLTITLSLVLLIVNYKFFKDYTKQPTLALAVVALLSVNPYMSFMSVRGLRLELYMIAILMLAYHVLVQKEGLRESQRLANLSWWGTVAVLQQINSLIFVLPLWVYAFWRQKIAWKKFWIAPVGLLLLIPYLVYSYQKFGDPFYSANVHAMWYRNYEFVVIKGTSCEGCPTLAEIARGKRGAHVTTFQYIFGMHSLGEVISRTAHGYAELFFRPTNLFWKQVGLKTTPVYYLYLLGLLLLIFSRFREILIFPILTINILAFLVPLGIDARLVMHTAPFVVFALVYTVWFVLIQGVAIGRRLKARPG